MEVLLERSSRRFRPSSMPNRLLARIWVDSDEFEAPEPVLRMIANIDIDPAWSTHILDIHGSDPRFLVPNGDILGPTAISSIAGQVQAGA